MSYETEANHVWTPLWSRVWTKQTTRVLGTIICALVPWILRANLGSALPPLAHRNSYQFWMPCPHGTQGTGIRGELQVLWHWPQGWVQGLAAAQRLLPDHWMAQPGLHSEIRTLPRLILISPCAQISSHGFSHLVTCTHIVSITFTTLQNKISIPEHPFISTWQPCQNGWEILF